MMYYNTDTAIIGLDHGYGNLKTANCCFPASFVAYDAEPALAEKLLVYENRYYAVGVGHREYTADKTANDDTFLLTLAGIGAELERAAYPIRKVYLAAGLPLTWVTEQRASFRDYLLQKKHVDFRWNEREYHLDILDAAVFPQGLPALISQLPSFKGTHVMCDIGNGTMNTLFINNGKPDLLRQYTEKFGTYQCVLRVREALTQRFGDALPDSLIEEVLRAGKADIAREYQEVIADAAREYTAGIMRRLREHGFHPAVMRLDVVGGGGCLIRNFGEYDAERTVISEDINAAAKGFEAMMNAMLMKKAKERRSHEAV